MAESKPLRIFLVDDDQDIIDIMSVLLEGAGHSVKSEVAGAYAISAIEREKPDCVVTDLMMAELDGLELCKELRGRGKLEGMTIIFVSAQTAEYWQNRAREAGADGYITKPLRVREFVGQVEGIVAGRPG
jgi:two-component system, OmpR family, alkaline phosphatase synthesis response regulator PhoP